MCLLFESSSLRGEFGSDDVVVKKSKQSSEEGVDGASPFSFFCFIILVLLYYCNLSLLQKNGWFFILKTSRGDGCYP